MSVCPPRRRLWIRVLMDKVGLPLNFITLLHRPICEAAAIAFPREGMSVDAWLCELTADEGDRLARALEARK